MSMSAALNDPRAVLTHNIQGRSSLPGDLMGCLSNTRGTVIRSSSPSNNEVVNQLKNAMDNPYVNFSEGERIAAAVLKGDTVPVSTSGQVVHRPHKDLQNQSDWVTRRSTKLNFLEVVSDAAPVHETNAADEMKKSKSSREIRQQGFTWAGQYVASKPEVFNIARDTELTKKRDQELKVMSIAHAQMLSKKTALERNREEVRNVRTESVRLRDELRKANARKLDSKKRLATVREKLYEKLKATNDPMMGPIMRCADDGFLHNFMEEYEGYSMSVDAVIAMLGKTLGTERKFVKPSTVDTSNHKTLTVENQPYGNSGYRVRSPKHPSPRSNSGLGATSNPQGLGLALPELKSPSPPPSWGRNVLETKTLGSGFRSKGSDFRRSPVPSPLRGGPRPGSGSRGAMRLVSTAQTSDELSGMFGADGHISRKKFFAEDDHHINSMLSISTTDDIADRSINALRTQLLEEGNLPSAQPEKILKDEEIHEIGSARYGRAKKTEKIIARRLDKKNKRLSSQNMNNFSNIKLDKNGNNTPPPGLASSNNNNEIGAASFGLGGSLDGVSITDSSGYFETGIPKAVTIRVTEAPEISVPRSIKTVESDQPVLLYNSFAEKTKFLAANVAAGASLPLWGNRSVSLHQQKYKPQKGTNVRSVASLNEKARDASRRLPVLP